MTFQNGKAVDEASENSGSHPGCSLAVRPGVGQTSPGFCLQTGKGDAYTT